MFRELRDQRYLINNKSELVKLGKAHVHKSQIQYLYINTYVHSTVYTLRVHYILQYTIYSSSFELFAEAEA